MAKVVLNKSINSSILDIGGGGEGIIGRIYQSQVTAIDNRKEELDEAPDGFHKILMDAAALEFGNETFDNVTSFYTFMFIEKEQHRNVLQEACRVLRTGGSFYIWDSKIQNADPFLVELEIDANGLDIHTTYGIYKESGFQDVSYFKSVCQEVGFELAEEVVDKDQFYLHFAKLKE